MSADLRRIRRGVGLAFIAFGVAQTIAALLGLGGRAYFLGYILLIVAGLLYLFENFRSTRTFYYETLADFLIGVAIFVVLMSPFVGPLMIVYGLWLLHASQSKPIHRA